MAGTDQVRRESLIVGTLRIAVRFAESLRVDPEVIGAQVAALLLDGFVREARS